MFSLRTEKNNDTSTNTEFLLGAFYMLVIFYRVISYVPCEILIQSDYYYYYFCTSNNRFGNNYYRTALLTD